MDEKANCKKSITADKSRDYLIDNIRAVLIMLVVWGHLLTSMIEEYSSLRSIYIFIFFFHMPAMVFISGYFSKNLDKIRSNAFVTILVPYLILNIISYLYKILIIREDFYVFRFFRPSWGLWYMLTLFLWKFFLKDLLRLRFVLPLSFIFALVSGFSREFSEYMALGRTVCFLPFFLLGYYCKTEHIKKIRRLPRIISMTILILVGVASTYLASQPWFKVESLFLRRFYPDEAQLEAMLLRAMIYVAAIAMIIAVTNLMTAKKNFLSYVGSSTLTVYVLHLFTIPLLEKLALFKDHPYLYLIYSILMTAIITYVYTLAGVRRLYDSIMNFLAGLMLKKEY
jgi:fucose 4-O-acetylase-like acetyltransferase